MGCEAGVGTAIVSDAFTTSAPARPLVARIRKVQAHLRPIPFTAGEQRLSQLVAGAVFSCWLLQAIVAAGADDASSFVPQLQPVICAGRPCGSMEISWYRAFRDGDDSPRIERNGVNIRGRFRRIRDQAREYHYLQALTRFKADDFRWSRDPDATLPSKFVDVPPFGVKRPETDPSGQYRMAEYKFDALPWFDEGEFPLFEDRPRAFLSSARTYGNVTMEFETWLVCVIDAKQGPDRDRVGDDTYVVATLIGWSWGYGITHRDAGVPGVDELGDYIFTVLPLRFLTQPSVAFEASLGASMGSTVTDRFDIHIGSSADCAQRR